MNDLLDKMRLRREIMSKISVLQSDKKFILLMREAVEMSRLCMNRAMNRWKSSYASYNGADLAPDINVADSFEGLSAEQLALDFPPTVEEISNIAAEVSGIVAAITSQLVAMDKYTAKIDLQINELYAQLAAL